MLTLGALGMSAIVIESREGVGEEVSGRWGSGEMGSGGMRAIARE